VRSITGIVRPRQPGQLGVQSRLVGLDDQQVVSAAADQEGGVVALGVQRVGRDHDTGKVQAGQQRLEGGHFTRRAVDLALGEHGAVMVVQRRQQVHLVALVGRAPQPLAVHRDDAAVTQRAQPVGQPRADCGVHRIAVHPCQHPADGGLAGNVAAAGERVTTHAQRGQDRPGRVGGPLGDRGHAAGAGHHRRGADSQHAGQGVASAPPVTGVGEHRQPLQQARALAHGKQAGMAGVGHGGGNGE
jgi:hypothetical protein